jgi:hypothetical protein
VEEIFFGLEEMVVTGVAEVQEAVEGLVVLEEEVAAVAVQAGVGSFVKFQAY